jgi:hypothetical protein
MRKQKLHSKSTNDRVAATDVPGMPFMALVELLVLIPSIVAAVAAGSFDVSVGNVSGGSLSQAIVINFVLLKGASS